MSGRDLLSMTIHELRCAVVESDYQSDLVAEVEQLRAEVARMRSVYEAAVAWGSTDYGKCSTYETETTCAKCLFEAAIDAAKGEP